jgi:AP2-like factor, ANT lineage
MGSTNNWLNFASFSAGNADAALHPLPPQGEADAEAPKLEDFLGLPELTAPVDTRPLAGSGASSIGLSKIKNWLRSRPAPEHSGVDCMALGTTATSLEGSRKVVDGTGRAAAPFWWTLRCRGSPRRTHSGSGRLIIAARRHKVRS